MTQTPRAVFQTIIDQIGVLSLMGIGARKFVTSDDECGRLTMRVGSGRRLTTVSVTLTGNDDYTVRYEDRTNRRGYRLLAAATATGVYFDMLPEIVLSMGEGRIDGYSDDEAVAA